MLIFIPNIHCPPKKVLSMDWLSMDRVLFLSHPKFHEKNLKKGH